MIFDELSNAACRLSLGGPGAELEGGCSNTPPPPARRGWRRAPARRGLSILVQSHVFPLLYYCSSVWGGAHDCRLDRLQKVIHFAARLITGLRRYDHVSSALDELGWPNIRDVIARRDVVNVRRALHDSSAPDSLRDMFHLRSAVSERLTRATAAGAAVIELPCFKLDVTRRLFPYRGAVLWNVQSNINWIHELSTNVETVTIATLLWDIFTVLRTVSNIFFFKELHFTCCYV